MNEIKSFVSTTRCYVLNIDDITYISYVDNNVPYATSNNTIYYNIYPLSSLIFKGLAARKHRYPYKEEDDYQCIYTPKLSTDFISCIQTYDTIYGLREPSDKGHCYANDNLLDWLAQDNGYSFPPCHTIQTHLYSYNENDKIYNVSAVMTGIEYNQICEIPGNQINNYYDGTIFATTIKTKNQYDAYYDMKKTSDSSSITNTRNYTGIYKCNNQIYLTYYDNITYKNETATHVTVPSVDINTNTLTANQFMHYSLSKADQLTTPTCKFPQIEVIENINRGICQIQHKSGLYSLQLNTTFIDKIDFSNDTPAKNNINKIKENIKQEIKNCIRTFAEKLAPANSQLFSITIT